MSLLDSLDPEYGDTVTAPDVKSNEQLLVQLIESDVEGEGGAPR